jgi:hypothetical protein
LQTKQVLDIIASAFTEEEKQTTTFKLKTNVKSGGVDPDIFEGVDPDLSKGVDPDSPKGG